jgi:biotin transporter BioY
MSFADFVLVFGPGLLQLHLWSNIAGKGAITFPALLAMGLFPFIPGEIIKLVAAASTAWVLSSKKDSLTKRE